MTAKFIGSCVLSGLTGLLVGLLIYQLVPTAKGAVIAGFLAFAVWSIMQVKSLELYEPGEKD